MWLRTVLPFGVLLAVTAAASEPSPACAPKACARQLDSEKTVCGSDGLSYPSRCAFEKARCFSKNLTISKRGPCRPQKQCRDWETYRQSHPEYKYQANCRPDGSYASAQCHPDSGFCWCVTPQGLPLPYTTVRWKPNSKQRCGGRNKKKSTRRRSPQRKGRNKTCKQSDKAKFNNNLINIFHTEWNREEGGGLSRPHNNETDTLVNQWKFVSLDLDHDGALDKNEYHELKRIIKKAVKPKRCAKAFPRSCDVNGDTRITMQEWAECLTRDGMDDGGGDDSSNGGGMLTGSQQSGLDDNSDDGDDYNEPILSHRLLPHALIGHGQYDDESAEIHDDDPTDCLSDQKAALLDGSQFYVPECTPDGRYKKIQCYRAAGYCFCVHEDTGKNIPGTSVKHGTPKCDQLTTVNRPMKGCPDDKKAIFLKDLLNFLHVRMSDTINGTKNMNTLPWISSKEEQAATWSFVVFDKNKNKMLDRNEWKTFKEIVSSVKSLKKCGKKLPRYCDINKDRHISMTEWLNCLNVQQVSTTSIAPSSSRAGKKNPLDVLLED